MAQHILKNSLVTLKPAEMQYAVMVLREIREQEMVSQKRLNKNASTVESIFSYYVGSSLSRKTRSIKIRLATFYLEQKFVVETGVSGSTHHYRISVKGAEWVETVLNLGDPPVNPDPPQESSVAKVTPLQQAAVSLEEQQRLFPGSDGSRQESIKPTSLILKAIDIIPEKDLDLVLSAILMRIRDHKAAQLHSIDDQIRLLQQAGAI